MAVRLTYPPGGGARVPVSRIRGPCGVNKVLPGKFPSAMAFRTTPPGCGAIPRIIESCCGPENVGNELRVTQLNSQFWPATKDCSTSRSTSAVSGAHLVASQQANRCINAVPRSRLCAAKPCDYYFSAEKLSYSKCQTYDQATQAKTACQNGVAQCCESGCPSSCGTTAPSELPCSTLGDVCRSNVVVRRNTAYSENQAVDGAVVTAETSRRAQDAGAASIAPPASCSGCLPYCAPVTRAAWRSGCGPSGCLPTNNAVLTCDTSYNPVIQRAIGAKPN